MSEIGAQSMRWHVDSIHARTVFKEDLAARVDPVHAARSRLEGRGSRSARVCPSRMQTACRDVSGLACLSRLPAAEAGEFRFDRWQSADKRRNHLLALPHVWAAEAHEVRTSRRLVKRSTICSHV